MLTPEFRDRSRDVIASTGSRLGQILHVSTDLRLVNPNDIDDLVKLDEACFEDLYYDADEFRNELSIPSSYGIVLCTAPGTVYGGKRVPLIGSDKRVLIAYVMGHEDNDGPAPLRPIAELSGKGAYIVSFAVHPKIQKRGIGIGLMACFEELSRMQAMNYLRLHTRTADNPESNGAYQAFRKMGFDLTGTLKDHYDKGDDACEVVKQLGQSAAR